MSILDRYIARQFLINAAVLMGVLCGFVVVVDTAYNLERFHRAATAIASQREGMDSGLARAWLTVAVVWGLWWPRLLYLFSFMLGLILVGAMGFTLSQLVRNRELVALLASGQSLHRVARPILLVALGMSLVSAVNQELVIPRIAPLLARDTRSAARTDLAEKRLPLTPDVQGRLWYAASYDPGTETMRGVYIVERETGSGRSVREVSASSARWDGAAWALEGARVVGGAGAGGAGPARVETTLGPLAVKVRLYEAYANTLSLGQAMWAAREVRRSGGDTEQAAATVDRMTRVGLGRVSGLVCNILVLVIAMCFFLTREPVNMFAQALKSAPVGIVGLLGGALSKSDLVPGLPAALAVFVPAGVLLPVAVAMWHRVKT